MALKRWTGSSYADVNLAKYGPSAVPKSAYIWSGSEYVRVWPTSIYPVSGTWPASGMNTPITTYATHTINENGTYTITHDVTKISGSGTVVAAIAGPWGTTSGSGSRETSTASTVRTLSQGNVINFQASRGGSIGSTASGAWSIVKN